MDASLLFDLVVGALAGIVSGLLGVGGGIVLTPVLHYGLGFAWADAVALSLFVIAVQSPIGVWRHRRLRAVSWRMAIPMTLAGAVGVAIGHLALPHIPVAALKAAFAVLLMIAAWRLGRKVIPRTDAHPWPVLAGVGLGAGVVSRLLGVGGGIITVPALGLLGVPVHLAVGTSLVAVFTNAAVASGANLAQGLDWMRGIPLAIGAVAGALGGVRLAHALPAARLQKVVAVAMVVVAITILIEAF